MLFLRDVGRLAAGGAMWPPVVFFLLVATLYPFAVGADRDLLARTGGGIVWVAALLAGMLPIDRLVGPDRDAGMIDQWLLRGVLPEWIMLSRALAHAVTMLLPLLAALVPAAALLSLSAKTVARLALGLGVAALPIAALTVAAAALTARRDAGNGLGGLLVLPLLIPVIIFGAGMLDPAGRGAFRLLAASSLILTTGGIIAAAAALRARD